MGARFGAVGSAKDVGWDVVVCDGVSESLLTNLLCDAGLPSMMPDASTATLAYEIAVVMRVRFCTCRLGGAGGVVCGHGSSDRSLALHVLHVRMS